MAGYQVLDEIVSKSSGDSYQIRRGGDGVLYCHNETRGRVCQGWLSRKNAIRRQGREGREDVTCKHVDAYVAQTGFPVVLGKPVSNLAGEWPKGKVPKLGSKKYVMTVPEPIKSAGTPAPPNWKEIFLKEQQRAESKGMKTPAAALAEFKSEIAGRFAALDVGEDEAVSAVPVASNRALDVE